MAARHLALLVLALGLVLMHHTVAADPSRACAPAVAQVAVHGDGHAAPATAHPDRGSGHDAGHGAGCASMLLHLCLAVLAALGALLLVAVHAARRPRPGDDRATTPGRPAAAPARPPPVALRLARLQVLRL